MTILRHTLMGAIILSGTVAAGAAAEWRYSEPGSAASEAPPVPAVAPAPSSRAVPAAGSAAPPVPFHDMPTNNMPVEVVRARYGDPQSTAGPVGEPPINRWYYPVYTVYFEGDRVLTSVVNRP